MRHISPLAVRLMILGGLVILISAVFQSLTPNYLSKNNFLGILRAMSVNGIVAIGLTFVIVVRKFDLSLTGIAALCAMTLGYTLSISNDLTSTIISSIAIGLIFGCINGLLVGLGRLPDVVTTIAVGSISYALAFAYNGGADYSTNFFSSGMVMLNFTTILGVQIPVFALIVITIIFAYLLHATRLGQSLYATGENPTAAHFSGVPTSGMMVVAFGICGALVGVAMVLQISGIGSSRVTAGGQIMLPAYTAVYLGAALMGRPSIYATLFGVLIMTMLLNGFTLMAVPYYYSDAVVSLILILAITVFDPKVWDAIRRSSRIFDTKGTAL